MKRRAALVAAAALLAAPAAASADTLTISMPGKFFDPPRSTSVAGDVILFKNIDPLSTHNVLIPDGVFQSGPVAPFKAWSQQIDRPGVYPFLCTLHAYMRGNLDVVAATLDAAEYDVLAGEPLDLSGRTAAGTARVGVEQSVSGGAWTAVGGATPAPDGTFTAMVPAVEGASYRATTAAGPGQVVTPRVTAKVDVDLQVHRMRGRTMGHVHTMPATTGFTATLQLYSRWHFRWRSVRSKRLDRDGGAMFRLPTVRRGFARVALRRRAHGPALVYSGVVKLPSGKASVDPETVAAPAPGGHDGGHGSEQH